MGAYEHYSIMCLFIQLKILKENFAKIRMTMDFCISRKRETPEMSEFFLSHEYVHTNLNM